MIERYKAPDIPEENATPTSVRDELLKRLESANKEFMRVLDQPTDDQALKGQVRQLVAGSFQSRGASFDRPQRKGWSPPSDGKSNAEAMTGPKRAETISHHYEEMRKLVDKLPPSSS
jgi:hypothetical protein